MAVKKANGRKSVASNKVRKASGNKSVKGTIESTHPKHAKKATAKKTAAKKNASNLTKKPISGSDVDWRDMPKKTLNASRKAYNNVERGAAQVATGAIRGVQRPKATVAQKATATAKKAGTKVTNTVDRADVAFSNKVVEPLYDKATKTTKKLKKKF